MDDMKDKMKGFMKKVTSSSSDKFKGQGRVLGSSSSPSGPVNPLPSRLIQPQSQIQKSNPPSSSSIFKPPPQKPVDSDQNKPAPVTNQPPPPKPSDGFDPYGSMAEELSKMLKKIQGEVGERNKIIYFEFFEIS